MQRKKNLNRCVLFFHSVELMDQAGVAWRHADMLARFCQPVSAHRFGPPPGPETKMFIISTFLLGMATDAILKSNKTATVIFNFLTFQKKVLDVPFKAAKANYM